MFAAILLAAQVWNSPAALTLVDRAIQRRRAGEAAVTRYTSRAEGVVLFLAQVGPDSAAVPRLVKADDLQAEVYWEAPNRSKQTVTAWRERRFLPTDISYHRDHLAIVTDDFGDAIRLGEGDEVRDVVHPLSPVGRELYEYALGDSLSIAAGSDRVVVREVLVRPRDDRNPLVVGSLYLDAGNADLVRFRFGFTRSAYREADLEDITVVLERALFEKTLWLPWRQQIEIRRRTAWLAFPLRTIIRARWDVSDYDVRVAPAPSRLAGGPYGGLRRAGPDTGWTLPIDSAIARAGGGARPDLDQLRRELRDLVSRRAIATEPPARLAFGSLSELVRVNSVQGLALGAGLQFNLDGGALTLEPRMGYGTSNERWTGGLTLGFRPSALGVFMEFSRSVRDLSEWPTISGVLNSLTSQEGGVDHGDWLELDRLAAGVRWQGEVVRVEWEAALEDSRSMATIATPSNGSYEPNPELGAGSVWTTRLGLHGRWGSTATRFTKASVALEAGAHDRGYVRATLDLTGSWQLGAGSLRTSLRGGLTTGTPPAWRTFVLGGRGTLPGDPYRAWGGRHMALGRLEWRIPMRLPGPRLGEYLDLGAGSTLAPFVALGWSGEALEGLPWAASDGLRPVLGLASELLFNALRVEAGWSPRAGRLALLVDASPAWWPIL
jgi:hypothetical protein